jgi:hypothetical protein
MAGRRVRRMTPRYREETLGPLASTIDAARSEGEALAMLNGALLRRMSTRPLAEAVEEHDVQTQCIGRATALRPQDNPPNRLAGSKATRQQGNK